MDGFHRSRGRILFEAFCALAIAASCVGTWMQTGAWALLAAASVAALYGLVRASDAVRRSPAFAAEPQSIDVADPPATSTKSKDRRTKSRRKGGDRRSKAAKQKATVPAPKESEVTELILVEEVEVAPPEPVEQADVVAVAPADEVADAPAEPVDELPSTPPPPADEVPHTPPAPTEDVPHTPPAPTEDVPHAPPARLFDPEPFVRQKRATFGRKAG